MSTLLQLCQDHCDKFGLPSPTAIVGSTDKTFAQLRALAHEAVEDLLVYPWQEQVKRVTWDAVATESQGAIETLFGAGYQRLIPATMWNNTLNRPVFGPTGDESWQALKAFTSGPIHQYKIMGGNLHILPIPTAGHDMSAIVATNYGIESVSGTAKARFTADDDVPLFPDNVFKAHLEWRWLKQKGEAWSTAYERAQGLTASLVNKDSHLPTFWLDQPRHAIVPGIIVPAGDWNVS